VDINAAGGSDAGVPHAQFEALGAHATSDLFSPAEHAALAMADAMTRDGTVPDAVFAAVRDHFPDDQIVELTATIAWENCSARFNRALHVPAVNLYHGGALTWPTPPAG
jgi:alkylhydroperoxidase family enzyme